MTIQGLLDQTVRKAQDQRAREIEAFVRQHVASPEDVANWHLVNYRDPLRLDFETLVLIPAREAEGFGDRFPPLAEASRRWPNISLGFRP